MIKKTVLGEKQCRVYNEKIRCGLELQGEVVICSDRPCVCP